MNTRFPEHPWDTVPAEVRGDWDASVRSLTDSLYVRLGGPRLRETGVAFALEALPPARVYLYPGGPDAEAMVEALEAGRPDIKILGVVDRLGSDYGLLKGYEVITPAALRECDFDLVVITNASREALLCDVLTDLGIDGARIFNTFSCPAYFAWCQPRLDSLSAPALQRLPDGIENVIIAFHPLSVMSHAAMARALPPRETVMLYMGQPEPDPISEHFRSISFDASLLILERLLRAAAPRVVLLSTFHVEAYMTPLVKRFCPRALLIHQIYDLSLLFPPRVIAPLHNTSTELIAAAHVGELYSARHYDVVVTKCSGPCWARFLEAFKADYLQYFQGAREPEGEATRGRAAVAERPLRIVYAGPVPPESEAEDWQFYRFQPLLDHLAASRSVHFEVYNSFHSYPHHDELFADFAARFHPGPQCYHPRVPNDQLVREIAAFDYGWMCLNTEETVADYPDTHTVISARVTGYISAGIPVIVDASWDAAVELIERFNAGFVIAEPTPETLDQALAAADPEVHRAGALALRDHMLAQNESVIAALAARVAAAGER